MELESNAALSVNSSIFTDRLKTSPQLASSVAVRDEGGVGVGGGRQVLSGTATHTSLEVVMLLLCR